MHFRFLRTNTNLLVGSGEICQASAIAMITQKAVKYVWTRLAVMASVLSSFSKLGANDNASGTADCDEPTPTVLCCN